METRLRYKFFNFISARKSINFNIDNSNDENGAANIEIVTVTIIMIILESYTVTSIYSFFHPARKLYISILNSLQNKKKV